MSKTSKPVLGMVLKGYPRISETFISNEILLLEELGYTVRIFSMRHPRENFSHKSVEKIRATVDYLPHEILPFLPKLLRHNIALLAKRPRRYLKALCIAARRFMRTRKSATLKHLLQGGYLVNHLLEKREVTHLHAHFAHSPTSVAMFAHFLSGMEFSFTGHAKDIYTSNPAQLREKIGLARFVFTCTEYNARFLKEIAKGLPTKIHCIYHGIDTAYFSLPEKPAEASPPYRIITVARMAEKKGLPTVYRALKLLKERNIDFHHTLIGDGDDREKTLSLIEELGLSGETEWLGTQPHHVVLEKYRESDLFVLGCRITGNGDRDGIPNVIVESLAMGVPVVSTEVSAIPEIIENGETGLLVSPEDPEALSIAMERLLTDGELRERVIAGGAQRVEAEFNNRALIRKMAGLYMEEGIHPAGLPAASVESDATETAGSPETCTCCAR